MLNIKQDLEEIRSIGGDLHKSIDKMNAVVKKIEEELKGSGVKSTVNCGHSHQSEMSNIKLRYARHGASFCFVIINNENEKDAVAWSQAKRELKIVTFPFIPELVGHISRKIADLRDNAAEVAKLGDEIMENLSDAE